MSRSTIEDLESLPDHEQERLDALFRYVVKLNRRDPAFGAGLDERDPEER